LISQDDGVLAAVVNITIGIVIEPRLAPHGSCLQASAAVDIAVLTMSSN
jgi:hypothetical protein